MLDKIEGVLEVGVNEMDEVVINHPDLKPDENGVDHIVFSPAQARNLASLLNKHAAAATLSALDKAKKAVPRYVHCKKCLTSRTGDILGEPCRTPGCDGIIEEVPEFSTLVDELPEPMTCGRRRENGMDTSDSPFKGAGPGLDRWQSFKSNGNRVCSYCGSLHPDDFFALVKACAETPSEAVYRSGPEIEPSDKGYKIYVQQPGVRNAGEGGIKFYTQHLPRNAEGKIAVTKEQEHEYSSAVSATRVRFDRYLKQMRDDTIRKVKS